MDKQLMGTLKVLASDGTEQLVSLKDGDIIKVGRDENNDITLNDPGVSRVHATFSVSANGVVIADMNSLNGVFVNGEKLSHMRDLLSKDMVDIGAAKITIELRSAEITGSLSGSSSSRAMTAQLKQVSVTALVVTVHDYHTLSESLPTTDVAEMLLGWCGGVTKIVEQLDGKIDKIIGSSIVAIWMGSEEKLQAENALKAAQRILKLPSECATEENWPHQAEHPWRPSVILNSGRGLIGAVGALSEGADGADKGFTLVGDPINRTFEFEDQLEPLGSLMIISDTTAALIQDVCKLRSLGQVTLKSQSDPVEVFSL
ncbi:adenylate/guanylate cyclase domain-containing protein [Oligoflexia bacterium]|nr:adenylate/guanylate cyclase domain-containing protein [Oligoflexia bacterium]